MSESGQNRQYYERRAVEERVAAERSPDERVRGSHLELARRYAEAAAGRGLPEGREERTSALLMPEFRILN